MTLSEIPTHKPTLHGYDDNTLLRMYDHAALARETGRTQQERERAELALERITRELRARGVRV